MPSARRRDTARYTPPIALHSPPYAKEIAVTLLAASRQTLDPVLVSGLIDQSQKMTVAARAIAEKKVSGQRS